MEEVLRRTSLVPLAFPCFVLCVIGVETEERLDYQGRAGIISIVRWNLRPVIFGVDKSVSRGHSCYTNKVDDWPPSNLVCFLEGIWEVRLRPRVLDERQAVRVPMSAVPRSRGETARESLPPFYWIRELNQKGTRSQRPTRGCCISIFDANFANPSSPYSIQKRPKPQICPKFVPTIVFRGSNQGDPNLSKKLKNDNFRTNFQFFDKCFDKFGSPWLEPRKTIVGTNFGQIWGSGRLWML